PPIGATTGAVSRPAEACGRRAGSYWNHCDLPPWQYGLSRRAPSRRLLASDSDYFRGSQDRGKPRSWAHCRYLLGRHRSPLPSWLFRNNPYDVPRTVANTSYWNRGFDVMARGLRKARTFLLVESRPGVNGRLVRCEYNFIEFSSFGKSDSRRCGAQNYFSGFPRR